MTETDERPNQAVDPPQPHATPGYHHLTVATQPVGVLLVGIAIVRTWATSRTSRNRGGDGNQTTPDELP